MPFISLITFSGSLFCRLCIVRKVRGYMGQGYLTCETITHCGGRGDSVAGFGRLDLSVNHTWIPPQYMG